jgi:putative holliday junction resolvase
MCLPSSSPRFPRGEEAGVILAIDYGRRRLGLALSDALGVTARPLATWTRSNRRRDLSRLQELCRECAVARIIVGRPLHLDGTQSEMADEAARFAERIGAHLKLPVELVDERLSSWEAGQTVAQVSGRARRSTRTRKRLDDVAAAVILRDYLSRAGDGAPC